MPVRLSRAHGKPADLLLQQIQLAGLPEPVREFKPSKSRKFAWDLFWPIYQSACICGGQPAHDHSLLVDVQGGTWARGKMGHSSGSGIERDYEKAALAMLEGYRTLYVSTKQVESGEALRWIQLALGA